MLKAVAWSYIMACNKIIRIGDHPARPIMSFNTLIGIGGGLPTGRYIGAGRDTSGPTGVPRPFTVPWVFRYSA